MAALVQLYLDDSNSKVDAISRALGEVVPPTPTTPATHEAERPAVSQRETAGGETALTELDGLAHTLKGGSASIGAPSVTNACINFRAAVAAADGVAMRAGLEEVREAFCNARDVLQKLLALELEVNQMDSGAGPSQG